MSLRRLIARTPLIVLGLNSGTSADGLDLAVLRIAAGMKIRMVAGYARRFPPRLKELILDTADSPQTTLEEIVRLDNYLGRFIGQTAAAYMKRLATQGITVHLVGSHGQTVRHVPGAVPLGGFRINGTLQLGSLDQIAAATGQVTVGDFRQADIAIGGEGAPITTGAMHRLFADTKESRMIVNIGGMANYFYFPARAARQAAAARDCGPGNSLCDILAARLFHRPFDRGGRIAASGAIHRPLLERLVAESFFSGRMASTGRETFGARLADNIIAHGRQRRIPSADLMTTAAELTVFGITRSVAPLAAADGRIKNLYLMGGGRHNRYLCQRLAEELPRLTIRPVDDLGIDGDLVEASAYAVMAAACIRSEALPSIARRGMDSRLRPVLGRIAQPPVRVHS